jgi:uncharacterized protein (DUF1499 family)
MLEQLRRALYPLAASSVLLVLVSGPFTRFGLFTFRFGFILLALGVLGCALAAAFGTLLLLVPKTREGRFQRLAIAASVSLGVATFPLVLANRARALPMIHDITTDTENPPVFVDILPRRAGAPNHALYEGRAIAAQQKAGYPDIAPKLVPDPPNTAYDRALKATLDMGWEFVSGRAEEGRIEATATTFWFGFKDDVVIRIRPEGSGSRIDVRSVSRVGRSDVGANAARIRAYLARF